MFLLRQIRLERMLKEININFEFVFFYLHVYQKEVLGCSVTFYFNKICFLTFFFCTALSSRLTGGQCCC